MSTTYRYGKLLVTADHGKWFWSNFLQLINFVPTGKRKSTFEQVLHHKQNTLAGALKVVAELERERSRE